MRGFLFYRIFITMKFNKKNLQEVVGVIPNVDETANKLYRGIVSSIENDDWSIDVWRHSDSKKFEFYGDFNVGEYNIDKANINLIIKDANIHDKSLFVLAEMGLAIGASVNRQNFKFRQELPNDEISIQIVIVTDFDRDEVQDLGDDFNKYVAEWIESKRTNIISSLSHEVAHAYGVLKQHPLSTLQRAYYEGAQKIQLPNIKPIQNIIFDFYFGHLLENLVRPNELDTLFKENKITPKQFYEALTSSRVYKKYQKMRDLNYDEVIQDLENNYIGEIDKVLKMAKAPIKIIRLPDNEKVIEFLSFVSAQLRSATEQSLSQFVLEPMEEMMVNFMGPQVLPKNKLDYMMDSVTKMIKRFPEDGEKFLNKTIKDMNIEGDKMTKKISKLYSIVASQEKKPLSNLEKYKRHKK